jgi:hypothetical protein
MAGTIKRFGPQAIANAVADIYQGGGGSVLCYDILTHLMIVNKTGGAVTFTLYLGATGGSAGGTEVVGVAKSVAANDVFHWYGRLKMTSIDFLSGLASAANSLIITGELERNVV